MAIQGLPVYKILTFMKKKALSEVKSSMTPILDPYIVAYQCRSG